MKKKLGWVPDLPDARHYAYVPKALLGLPKEVDLRAQLPGVWDQKSIGSCVAHGVAACHVAAQRKAAAGKKEIMPSRLALYYQARAASGWTQVDSGCYVVQAMKVVAKFGVADEKLWPYAISKFKDRPNAAVYKDALLHQGLVYRKIDSTQPVQIKAALAAGLPVVFGSTLYENSYNLVDNVMPMPDLKASVLGGHCMALVGYDDDKRLFLVRNSWGKAWGDNGHHWMPYDYICNLQLTDDVWCLETVEV